VLPWSLVERMGIWIGDEIECDIRPKKKRDVISFQNNKILKENTSFENQIQILRPRVFKKIVSVHVFTKQFQPSILTIKLDDTFFGIKVEKI